MSRLAHSMKALFTATERFALAQESPIPLYHQIEKVILDRMAAEGAVGSLLPTEKAVMVMFGVSRATARRAYEGLTGKGLIERRRALGTRVISQEISEDLGRLKSFTEEMKLKGLGVCSELLKVGKHRPEPLIASKMRLEPGEETYTVQRLRGSSAFFPIVLLTSDIPVRFGVDPRKELGDSLYKLIEEKHRIMIEWAEEEIKSARATEAEARLLRIQPGDVVLVMERLTYTRIDERPIEFVRGVYRPEHYTFSIRLKR